MQASEPKTLPVQATDLSVRFHHIEPVVKSSDLIALWACDEGSGYEFRDSSGHRHHAPITGSQWNTRDSGLTNSFRHDGRRGGGVYLNGTQWLQAAHHPTLNAAQQSWTLWLRPESTQVAAPQTLLAKIGEGNGYALMLEADGALRFSATGSAEADARTAAGSVRAGEWAHIVLTFDGTREETRIYRNGVLLVEKTQQSFLSLNNEADFTIGHAPFIGSRFAVRGFSGWLDEISLHNRVLSSSEIQRLYALGFPKTYVQSRETINENRADWTRFHGNQPVPHPVESDTIFSLPFNGDPVSVQGHHPQKTAAVGLAPGRFGGAFDATKAGRYLTYASPVAGNEGTFEAWLLPAKQKVSERAGRVLFEARGRKSRLQLGFQAGRWTAILNTGFRPLSIKSPPVSWLSDTLLHVALVWKPLAGSHWKMALFLNGAEVASGTFTPDAPPLLNETIAIGGSGEAFANAFIDDVRLSNTARNWGEVCPRGHADTESASLDVMDSFNHVPQEPLVLWQSGNRAGNWAYVRKSWEDDGHMSGEFGGGSRCLHQGNRRGLQTLFHPDAYGYLSSVEAGVSFDKMQNGWAGVFVQSPPASGRKFSGYTFMLNPAKNAMRIAVWNGGVAGAARELPYNFTLSPQKTYALTLTFSDRETLRGYVDGNNLISLQLPTLPATLHGGFAGLITQDAAACFDDLHFTALTPATSESRRIERRVFSDGELAGRISEYSDATLHSFRWKKRHGLLPAQRTYKAPEPPGNIFGAADDVARPNASQLWRSEDSANSTLLKVDGTVFYNMRGNPRIGNSHGPSRLGFHSVEAGAFDGLHFHDQNAGVPLDKLDDAELLRGHRDIAPPEARDREPRHRQFQINDQGMVLLGRKILVVARESRNYKRPYPWFFRLVFGLYDVQTRRWDNRQCRTVSWSAQSNPADAHSRFTGLNGTPELTALRDPKSDEYIVLLYHGWAAANGIPTGGVTGLSFDGKDLHLHEAYPTRSTFTKPNQEVIYGERVFFDNGIYYMNCNAGSEPSRLRRDWPDRFFLTSTLNPYEGPWISSRENFNEQRSYFARGSEFDPDNGAIWQGAMFKWRNTYYLYYENYHSIDNTGQPYENYDHISAGSRFGGMSGPIVYETACSFFAVSTPTASTRGRIKMPKPLLVMSILLRAPSMLCLKASFQ